MTNERFNELLNGPLYHPMMPFTVTRLARALEYVLSEVGVEADAALETFCEYQKAKDEQD